MLLDHSAVAGGAPGRLTGLEHWDWHDQPLVPERLLRAMQDHPDFPRSHRASVEAALVFADTNLVFQQMILDMGGLFLCLLTLYMDATTGISHRALRELAGGGVVLSAGRATAILWKLRSGKFVEAMPDGRFVPTRLLRDSMRARMRQEFAALRLMEPGADAVLARFEDDDFAGAFIRHLLSDLKLGGTDRPDDADLTNISAIGGRAAGMLINFALLLAANDQSQFPPLGRTTTSISAIARRFGVSRRHVLRVLRDMEGMGFVTCRDDEWVILPPLARVLSLFHALISVRNLRAAHRALAEG